MKLLHKITLLQEINDHYINKSQNHRESPKKGTLVEEK